MNIIVALLVFGFIVFSHELGHFYFAKRAGVTIHEFSIGMGPTIYEKEKEGIKYSLRLLPIGGFVAMEGEDEESDDPNSFEKKTIVERLKTILAGPIANIVLCILLLLPVYAVMGTPSNYVDQVPKNMPAYTSGIRKDDQIISLDGKKVDSFEDLTKIVNQSKGKEMKLEYKRNQKLMSTNIKPISTQGRYQIGVTSQYKKNNPLAIVKYSFTTTYSVGKGMLEFLWKLVTGQLSNKIVDSLSGPVGVINMVSNAATNGFVNVLYLTAIISLNIGIMNLLPIPALDGWRILILLLEALRKGKKLPAKVEGYINAGGLVFLLSFMLFITYKDILRIFFK